jgi:hypothetical protein
MSDGLATDMREIVLGRVLINAQIERLISGANWKTFAPSEPYRSLQAAIRKHTPDLPIALSH